MIKESFSRKVFVVFNTLFLIGLAIVQLYPVLYVIFASLSDGNLLMAESGLLLHPAGFSLDAYRRVLENAKIWRGYCNTFFVVSVSLIFNMLLTSFAAYFLSRKYLYTRNFIMMFIVFTMYFSGGLVPHYLTIRQYGLYNTLWSLIVPSAISSFNLIILRTGFESIPDSLEESARIDGAGHFTILFRIIMPLSKATLAVIFLYYLVGHWNAWFNASIYLQDAKLYPLQLILRNILIQNDTSSMAGADLDQVQAVGETVKYAIIVVATLPVMCIYPFLQKYFAKGAMIGAVKG